MTTLVLTLAAVLTLVIALTVYAWWDWMVRPERYGRPPRHHREIMKRGYELGSDDPAPDKLPPVPDPGPGPGAGATPRHDRGVTRRPIRHWTARWIRR